VSKKREILHGYKLVLLGLLLMALVYAAIAATRTFGADNKLEFVALAGLIVAWLPVLLGTLMLRKESPQFEYTFIVSIVSLVALFAQTGMGIKNFLNNMEEQTFIQFDVMFFGYIALLGMVVIYRMMMRGVFGLSGGKSDKKTSEEWKTVWLVGLIVIFAGTLFIPVATLFSSAIEKIMAGLVILIVLGAELYWCGYINKSAQALQKKR
jgi:undecaprenyl pyrophosphate phosphatase UppP